MKSANLVNWELVGYVFDRLEDNDAHNLLDGKGIYGQGSWAASLRHHNDTFYVVFSCNDMKRFYIYQTKDIEHGPWTRSTIEGVFHDPALLFEDDREFVVYGNGDVYIAELTEDGSGLKPDGIHQLLFVTETEGMLLRCEGCHAYKINHQYYLLFIEWPTGGNGRRRQIAYRSNQLLGTYERHVIFDDDMGYHNHGIAQGALVDTPEQEWYALLFQDHDAVGRIPYVLPVEWRDGWPMVGIDGRAPQEFSINLPPSPQKALVISDEFDYTEDRLALNWQWNHNPDDELWSVTKRPGWLRLETGTVTNHVLLARNTLTQRTEGPACIASTRMDTSNMKPGDHAGLIALQSSFGTVGVRIAENGDKCVVMSTRGEDGAERAVEQCSFLGALIHLKIDFNFENSVDIAYFYYSADGIDWVTIGEALHMKYTLDHFMGYRIGLFNYASKHVGGYADFDSFHYVHKTRA